MTVLPQPQTTDMSLLPMLDACKPTLRTNTCIVPRQETFVRIVHIFGKFGAFYEYEVLH